MANAVSACPWCGFIFRACKWLRVHDELSVISWLSSEENAMPSPCKHCGHSGRLLSRRESAVLLRRLRAERGTVDRGVDEQPPASGAENFVYIRFLVNLITSIICDIMKI